MSSLKRCIMHISMFGYNLEHMEGKEYCHLQGSIYSPKDDYYKYNMMIDINSTCPITKDAKKCHLFRVTAMMITAAWAKHELYRNIELRSKPMAQLYILKEISLRAKHQGESNLILLSKIKKWKGFYQKTGMHIRG